MSGVARRTRKNGGIHPPHATETARSLRHGQTGAEKAFWNEVKAKRFNGYKFRRQFPMGSYVVDFACVEECLIVEIDGGQHCENVKDEERTKFLKNVGYRIVRFWNNEVLENIAGVLEALSLALSLRERGQGDSSPSPSGRGRGEGRASRQKENIGQEEKVRP